MGENGMGVRAGLGGERGGTCEWRGKRGHGRAPCVTRLQRG